MLRGEIAMFVDFNKVFKKTKEEEIKMYEDILQMYKDNVGTCRTCVHYIYYAFNPNGIYTVVVGKDEECDICPDIFAKSINRKSSENICPYYEYDQSKEKFCDEKIKEIKEKK